MMAWTERIEAAGWWTATTAMDGDGGRQRWTEAVAAGVGGGVGYGSYCGRRG